MARIYKRKNVWYLDVRSRGKRIRKRVGTSKKVAELALKDAEVKLARDEFGFSHQDIPLEQFIDQFLDYSRANHRPSTTTRYRAVLDHFRSFIGSKKRVLMLSAITPHVIDQYKIHRRESWVNPNGYPVNSDSDVRRHTRKGAQPYTINFEINALKTAFNVAIKWGYMRENPAKGIRKLKVTRPESPRFLSVAECQRLLQAAPPELYPIWYVFLNTGMRKAELENLQWSDIDFRRRKIKIRRKPNWQPKTGEREIPMSDGVHKVLTERLQRTNRNGQEHYVFCDKRGDRLKSKLREKLIQTAKKAGIENLSRVHTLRHTFASHLVMNGVDLPTVMKLMGHTDIQTTMIYAHLAADHLSEAINKLDLDGASSD